MREKWELSPVKQPLYGPCTLKRSKTDSAGERCRSFLSNLLKEINNIKCNDIPDRAKTESISCTFCSNRADKRL